MAATRIRGLVGRGGSCARNGVDREPNAAAPPSAARNARRLPSTVMPRDYKHLRRGRRNNRRLAAARIACSRSTCACVTRAAARRQSFRSRITRYNFERMPIPRWTRPLLIAVSLTLATPWPGVHGQGRAHSTSRATETALDRYVAAPDAAFTWKAVGTLPAEGVTATLIQMTSQRWLTEKEVEQPLWTHWITVIRPEKVTTDIALLFITGGRGDRDPPREPPAWLVDAARATAPVPVELRLVPNQPVVFKNDPARKPRVEADFIAYTWNHYIRTGDDRWPARLPMTKSAVRAMDAVTAFTASPEGGAHPVRRFVVSGASKRGWTTWATAAVDTRV